LQRNIVYLLYNIKIRSETGSTSIGPGANSIVKSLTRDGFKILNILDSTRIPRGDQKSRVEEEEEDLKL
jgi:ribosomal protein S11